MVVGIGVLDTELAVGVGVAVDHLRVVIVSLGLNLVADILLKDICGLSLRILNGCHHVGPCGQMGIVLTFSKGV